MDFKSKIGRMMRILATLFIAVALIVGGTILWKQNPEFQDSLLKYIENGEFLTLQPKYTAEEILQHHQEIAPKYGQVKTPALKFYPYLLLQVKYPEGRQFREGIILWDLIEGEMVLNTEKWEKTRGFQQAIETGLTRSDFALINILKRHNGPLNKNQLQYHLNIDEETLENWLDHAHNKQLISERGQLVYLRTPHISQPDKPETQIRQWLVTKPYSHALRAGKHYSKDDIERIALAAFGGELAIKSSKEIYVPIYRIDVVDLEGNIEATHWNAVTGKQIVLK